VSLTSVGFSEAAKEPTHKQAFTIKPELPGKTIKLETFCVGPRGNLWMACRSNSGDGSPDSGLIMVYDPSGLLFDSFPLTFVPQAINFSPNSKLYLAGSGKIARVALNGIVEIEIDAPNIGNREAAIGKAREKAEQSKSISKTVLSSEPTFSRLMASTAIAATDNEVYVSCPEPVGNGYGV